jgi:hypothetical protein
MLRCSRTFEVKDVTVPARQLDSLKRFYRIIDKDEHNSATLRPRAAQVAVADRKS